MLTLKEPINKLSVRLIFLLFIGLSCFGLNAQQFNKDSLWSVWEDDQYEAKVRLRALHTVAWKGYMFTQPDSAFYFGQVEYDFAESLGLRLEMGNARNSQAVSFYFKGEYANSIKYYQEAYELFVECGNEKNIANAVNNIGMTYQKLGSFDKALEYYLDALRRREKLQDQKGLGSSHLNIAVIYYKYGDYETCMKHNLTALDLFKKSEYKKGVGQALGNIGSIYKEQGNLPKAISHYEQSLKLKQEINDVRGIATSYENIGLVHYAKRDTVAANIYFKLALAQKASSGNKNGLVSAYRNLGMLYKDSRNYNQAIDCYAKSKTIAEEIGNSFGVANTNMNMALVYGAMGDTSLSIKMIKKSLSINNEIDYGLAKLQCLNNLAFIYLKLGQIDSSLSYAKRAHQIGTEMGTLKDVRYASGIMFRCYNARSDQANSWKSLLALLENARKDIDMNLFSLTEYQKENYLISHKVSNDLFLDYKMVSSEIEKVHTAECYNGSLLFKGILLNSSTALRSWILNSDDSLLTKEYYDWLNVKHEIANLFADGNNTDELEERANQLERKLVRRSQDFSTLNDALKLTWKDVQSGLENGESAIEFVRFTHQVDYRNDSDKVQLYAALIINNKSEHPKMIRLFEELELEKILGTFPGNNLSYIEQVYGSKENTKSQLYDLIWKPMEEELTGAKKVYVSPVGLLHKISFAALAKEQDVFLCDLYEIETQSSTGKIALPTEVAYNENSSTTLFGGIDYNSDSTSNEIWNYLNGSLSETQAIEKILKKGKRQYNYFNQSNATEAQFKDIASNSNILHIATHGFFYADPDQVIEETVDEIESNQDIVFRGGRTGFAVNSFVKSRNPLMRSGLVFAGANDVWNRTESTNDTSYTEDGVLTAAEVATIDMRNTDLVVLSACETGLGDIKGSEGVYGLQRSFKMAGVKYLIMSLWQVPDKETAEFMTSFYKNLTETNDIKESFNATQKGMREKYDPYYWAAFVLVE